MKTSCEPPKDNWSLIIAPESINSSLHGGLAALARYGPLRVLDCGRRYDPYLVWRQLRSELKLMDRIQVRPAYTCTQVLSELEAMAGGPETLVILDLLRPFREAGLPMAERKRLLQACLGQLDRISAGAAVDVSVYPTRVPGQMELELLELLYLAKEGCQMIGVMPKEE